MRQFKRTSVKFQDFITEALELNIRYIICLDVDKNIVSVLERNKSSTTEYALYDVETGKYLKDKPVFEILRNDKYDRFLLAQKEKQVKKYFSRKRILGDWIVLNIVNRV